MIEHLFGSRLGRNRTASRRKHGSRAASSRMRSSLREALGSWTFSTVERLEDRKVMAAFTAGNLVVLQSDAQTSSATSVSLLEFTTSGTSASNTIALPSTAAASGNAALTQSGSATSEGFLSRTQDGRYLVCAHHNHPLSGPLGRSFAAARSLPP